MNFGEVTVGHYRTREALCIRWRDGRIVDITSVQSEVDAWLAPPLVDLQINGYAGVDFQQDDLTADHLLHAVRQLRLDGCTRFLLTLITDEWPRLTARLERMARLRSQHPELVDAILGWHIEGPFLSAEPGYCGAHDPACMIDPTPGHVDELRRLAGPARLLLTMAPERRGALETIEHARQAGVLVQLGHSNAGTSELHDACGEETFFTHLGNACPQQLDRHDNILWRVLNQPGMGVSLIPDGIHVSPELFCLIHRTKPGRIYYTTDAMSAAGAPPGRYRLGRLELEVGEDRIVRLPGRTHFAGSACTPIGGVLRAAEMLYEPWSSAWQRFSEVPARLLNRSLELQVGGPAEFCLLRFGGDSEEAFWGPPRLQTFVAGEAFERKKTAE